MISRHRHLHRDLQLYKTQFLIKDKFLEQICENPDSWPKKNFNYIFGQIFQYLAMKN
jgi:hypothetical protein